MIHNDPMAKASASSSAYTDFSKFDQLRAQARDDNPEALEQVAKQFEGMFINMMLSSMRDANQLFNEDSLFSSKDVKFYQGMLDQQLSSTLTEGKGIGFATSLVQQLSQRLSKQVDSPIPNNENPIDASALKPISAHSIDRQRVILDTPQDKPDEKIKAFVEQIKPYAQQAAKALGVPANSLIAQAALETGWGDKLIVDDQGQSANNIFGIKADKSWNSAQVATQTTEYRKGIAVKETADFRRYPDVSAAFNDYVKFLQSNPRYAAALDDIRSDSDPKNWGELLQKAGYATDPNYGKKIADITNIVSSVN